MNMSQKVKHIDDKKETVTFRSVSHDEEGRKRVEKTEVDTHNIDTLKHIEKKLIDKGVHRLDRHPRDGLLIDKQPKSGRGGKYTWEGPARDMVESVLYDAPAVLDEGDPNYVDEAAEERVLRGEVSGVEGLVVGEVEVAKVAESDGIGRVDIDPKLEFN